MIIYLFIYLLYISYNILTSWHATATNEEAGKNALTTLLFSKTAILWQLVKLLIASRVLSSHQAVLSCLSCAGLVNRDGAVAIPDAVTGGEGAVFLWDKRSCRLLYQVIRLAEVLHWAFSCQALRVEVGAQLLFRDTPCEQHGLWRLQRDVEADPYSLSIPHYQLGCFFLLLPTSSPSGEMWASIRWTQFNQWCMSASLGPRRIKKQWSLVFSLQLSRETFSASTLTIKHQVQGEAHKHTVITPAYRWLSLYSSETEKAILIMALIPLTWLIGSTWGW